ncbi:MAG: alanine racemase, partial [Bacteroidetes bacterium]|nr:alanine racemase [Bacteroidota bacterium]
MIQENIKQIRAELPKGVRLVCVSKFHSNDDILEAYNVGERDFGESRVQELMTKQPVLPSDIRWHFIGPLQTNKIKQIVPFVTLIHSIENMRQIEEIQKCAAKIERVVDILLEVHIAREEQKHG